MSKVRRRDRGLHALNHVALPSHAVLRQTEDTFSAVLAFSILALPIFWAISSLFFASRSVCEECSRTDLPECVCAEIEKVEIDNTMFDKIELT